jgi:small subunit ribosomal protein S6
MAQTEASIRFYEGVWIAHPDASEADLKKLIQRNAQTIEAHQGKVNHVDTWGKRRLSSPIKKMKLGTYFHSTFEANTECVQELERLMRIDDKVLRFSHVRLDERRPINEYVEEYHRTLAEAHKREQEKDAKRDARRAGGGFKGPGRRREDEDLGDAEFTGDEE